MPSPRRHLSVDELSHRASTGLAIRKGDIKISDPIPSSYIHNGPEMDFDTDAEQPVTRRQGALPRRSGMGPTHGRSESGTQQMHVSRFTENTSLGASPLIDNNAQFTPSHNLTMQRNGSGFRATLRRMFSKKDKSTILQKRSVYQDRRGQTLSHSVSHSGHLNRSLLTAHNISRSDALHSHAVSPHLDTSSEFAPSQDPEPGQFGTRRNTVPSLSLLQEDARITTLSEGDHKPVERPKTATKRSSPSQPQFKRRSRSAGALADLLRSSGANMSQRQDRAEQIAYWRNSILTHPMPQFLDRVAIDSVVISEPTVRSETSPARPGRPSIEPVQDFDFGLNEGTQSARPTTLQERVNTLEVKLFDFEYALATLQGNKLAKPDLPQRVSARRSTREHSSPENVLSITESSSSSNSPPLKRDEFASPTSPRERRVDRASKATTVRPVHRRTFSSRSHASSPRSIHLSSEQYDILYNLIKDERVARQQLESQVTTLQKEVDTLKQPVYNYVGSAGYPTPSPDSLRNQPVLPARPRVRRQSPNLRDHYNHINETSRFSTTETESDTDAGELSPEVYETPQGNAFRFEPRSYTTTYHNNMI